MRVRDDLRKRLATFDRKAMTVLTEAAAALGKAKSYPAALADLAADEDEAVSSGATWLIKYHAESGAALPAAQCRVLAANLDRITAWDAQLHICQSARLLPYPAASWPQLHAFATSLLRHERPFLRAWSLDLLCHLAQQDPQYEAEASRALSAMSEDKAASVRARARILKKAASARRGD